MNEEKENINHMLWLLSELKILSIIILYSNKINQNIFKDVNQYQLLNNNEWNKQKYNNELCYMKWYQNHQ